MASSYTTRLRLEKPGTGEQSGTWGGTANTDFDLLDASFGLASITHDDTANYTLTANNGSSDEARCFIYKIGGTLTAARNAVVPTASKVFIVHNNTTGGYAVTVKTSGGSGVSVANGKKKILYCDGTDVVDAATVVGDAELEALAGLTSAADKIPYFTGSGTAALADLTAFGRSLIDDAAATNARTTLGLAIGTDVQAYDAELAAIAGLTSAADKIPYFTGSGTAALTDFTSTARSLVDDTSVGAMRTTLGVSPIPLYAHYQNQQTSGTTGPTYNTGAWRTVTLNTEVYDADAIGSLSANQVTLAAGTYEVSWRVQILRGGANSGARTRLYNATDTAAVLQGINASGTGSSVGSDEVGGGGHGIFTLAGSKALELQVYVSGTNSTAAVAVSSGEVEVYADFFIKKVA